MPAGRPAAWRATLPRRATHARTLPRGSRCFRRTWSSGTLVGAGALRASCGLPPAMCWRRGLEPGRAGRAAAAITQSHTTAPFKSELPVYLWGAHMSTRAVELCSAPGRCVRCSQGHAVAGPHVACHPSQLFLPGIAQWGAKGLAVDPIPLPPMLPFGAVVQCRARLRQIAGPRPGHLAVRVQPATTSAASAGAAARQRGSCSGSSRQWAWP